MSGLDRHTTVTKIRQLLAKRHVDDVFYEEVTIARGARRMDAWAMKKSWANPMVIAYEIKSSRQDFMSDHKMQDYLPYCNEAYVVCPQSACTKDEIPDGFGLIYLSKNGEMLRTVKKSPYSECVLPEKFMRGLLFSKAYDYANSLGWAGKEIARRVGLIVDFENYVEDRKNLQGLGYGIATKLKERERQITRIEEMQEDITKQYKTFNKVFSLIQQKYRWGFGCKFRDMVDNEDAQGILDLLETAVPDQYSSVISRMEALKNDIEKLLASKEESK